ncbi:metal-dependent hydrolase [Erythrobacter crassostreae]|uniref:Metal-dependent hydrolase n=1 Tax=Erythrobacter crassostreae TaxID=2828328 RepID=A0A9X1F4Z4_9SPHN|nr:metal-dependent hydrolase [Erythrobacter crassostrea]MBV7260061.1 metal-dependent hydrolase [Erythrobacter crassostrea]
MDNLTHSLVGAVLGQAGLKKKTGLAMPALIIGANLPDVDAACFFWLEGTEHLGFRRGITHGPPALVILPLILAALLWGFDRWQEKRGKRPEGRRPVHFGWLYGLSFIGALSHPLFDWLNVYGIRFFEPFSSQWFYGDTLFIIDVWLWAMLIVSVWWSLRAEKKGGNWTKPAWVGIAAALAYIAMNWAITQYVDILAKSNEPYGSQVIVSPVPVYFWERERIIQMYDGEWISNEWNGADFDYGFKHSQAVQCVIPDLSDDRLLNSQLDAFLFWSRAPFAERAEDGSVILRDARFYDPRARDRFSIALPDVKCEELTAE